MALIGSILNTDADTDNDDVVDGGYAHCTTTTDADVTTLIVAMANAVNSLSAVGSVSTL